MRNEHAANIPAERKLELIRLMRSESHQNRQTMRGRERILYDTGGAFKTLPAEYADGSGRILEEKDRLIQNEREVLVKDRSFSSLKLRLFAALLLFAAFVAWDNGYYPALPKNNGQIYGMIEQDMLSANLFAFMEDFTYTLKME